MTVDQVKLQHSPKSGLETRDPGTQEPRTKTPTPGARNRDPETRDPGNETPGPRDQQPTPTANCINPTREANPDNKKLGCVY